MNTEDMVLKEVKEVLNMYKNYFYYDELNVAKEYLTNEQLKVSGIQEVMDKVAQLEKAIESKDIEAMKPLCVNPNEGIKAMDVAFEALTKINREEENQIFIQEIMY